MSHLITVVGASGVGKTALVRVLAQAGDFETAFEQHAERPFQAAFKADARYALANQIDYLLLRAEQERQLRASPHPGLMDGGLDLDFHGFTRLFLHRGLLTDAEYGLCQRLYLVLRDVLPLPELVIHLRADAETIAGRLSTRDRVNIASAEDTLVFNSFVDAWVASLPAEQVVELDVSRESPDYERSVRMILSALNGYTISQ